MKLYNGAPQGSKLRRVYGSGANCPPAALVVCTLGTLSVNQSKTVTVDVLVDANQTAPITHQARATADEGDPVPRNNGPDQTQDLKVTPAPDLSVNMTASGLQAGVGQDVTYTVTTANGGPIGVSNVALRFMVPDGMSFQSVNGTNCSYSPESRAVSCGLGSFGVGSGPTVNVVARPTRAGAFATAVTVFAAEPERDVSNNSARVTLQAAPGVNLSLSQSASTGTIPAGDQITYTTVITNSAQATATATRVQLTGNLQTGTTFVSAQGGNCLAHADKSVTCDVESIAPGQSRTVSITAVIGTIGTVTQQFLVGSAEGDSNPGDNATSIQTTVVARSCSPRPNVRLAISPAGPNAVYVDVIPGVTAAAPVNQVSVIRFGTPNPLVNAVIDVNGQGNMSGAFAVTFPRSLQAASVRFTVRRVTPGQPIMAPFTVDDDCGPWVTFVGAGTNAWANPWGSVLTLSPVSGPSAPRVGTNMTYTVQAKNDGIHNAETVTVVNTVPEGTTLVSATASQGTCTTGLTFQCAIGRLDPGASATLTFTVNPTTVGETANWTYATSGVYDLPGQENLVMPIYINPTSPPPNTLPGQRPAPTQSGTPATFPGSRPNDPSSGQPSVLPGSR